MCMQYIPDASAAILGLLEQAQGRIRAREEDGDESKQELPSSLKKVPAVHRVLLACFPPASHRPDTMCHVLVLTHSGVYWPNWRRERSRRRASRQS